MRNENVDLQYWNKEVIARQPLLERELRYSEGHKTLRVVAETCEEAACELQDRMLGGESERVELTRHEVFAFAKALELMSLLAWWSPHAEIDHDDGDQEHSFDRCIYCVTEMSAVWPVIVEKAASSHGIAGNAQS